MVKAPIKPGVHLKVDIEKELEQNDSIPEKPKDKWINDIERLRDKQEQEIYAMIDYLAGRVTHLEGSEMLTALPKSGMPIPPEFTPALPPVPVQVLSPEEEAILAEMQENPGLPPSATPQTEEPPKKKEPPKQNWQAAVHEWISKKQQEEEEGVAAVTSMMGIQAAAEPIPLAPPMEGASAPQVVPPRPEFVLLKHVQDGGGPKESEGSGQPSKPTLPGGVRSDTSALGNITAILAANLQQAEEADEAVISQAMEPEPQAIVPVVVPEPAPQRDLYDSGQRYDTRTIWITSGFVTSRIQLKKQMGVFGHVEVANTGNRQNVKEEPPFVRFGTETAANAALEAMNKGQVRIDGATISGERVMGGKPEPKIQRPNRADRDLEYTSREVAKGIKVGRELTSRDLMRLEAQRRNRGRSRSRSGGRRRGKGGKGGGRRREDSRSPSRAPRRSPSNDAPKKPRAKRESNFHD